jgi:Zn-dependent protease
MRDPLTWSLSLGRWLGIHVRVHVLFVLFVILRLSDAAFKANQGVGLSLQDAFLVQVILFACVLLHEFGHCFAARAVGGSADEILMWPLGGLAYVNVPNTPRHHFVTTAAGPAVNVVLCLVMTGILVSRRLLPPLNPFGSMTPFAFDGGAPPLPRWVDWVAFTFRVNWILFLFNLLPAFPMDGGRIFRCLLWPRMGFGRATVIAVQVAKVAAIGMGLLGVVRTEFQLVAVAVFVYVSSENERRMLEAGMLFDDSVFGYDFSQGYTSLEAGQTPRRARKQPGILERWRQRRDQAKREREERDRREQDERVDRLLQKIREDGMDSLSEQEKRFLRDMSAKFRARNRTR